METVVIEEELTIEDRRDFLKKPLEERRRLMQLQAIKVADLYLRQSELADRLDWQGGDLVEHAQQ